MTYFGTDLPIGIDNQLQPGRYYRNIMDITYRCECVQGGDVHMFVFLHQHGKKMAARVPFTVEHAPMYVDVTDSIDTSSYEAEYQQCLS